MKSSRQAVSIILFAAFALIPVLSSSDELAPVSQSDCVRLLERLLPGSGSLTARASAIGGHAGYRFSGSLAEAAYEAEIDAVVPRVLSLRKDGQSQYAWPGIYAVAHRGAMRFAPENTVSSFKKAIELGAHYIEMDVRQTKDGQFVIMHDPFVLRTTRVKGVVAEMTLAEIKQLDAGARFSPEFAGERVPTLEEALDALAGRARPDIDFKAGDPAKVVGILREKGFLGKATFANGDPAILRTVTERSNGQILIRPPLPQVSGAVDALQRDLNPPLVNIDDLSRFRDIHLVGMKVFTNTMSVLKDDEKRIKAALAAHADYIQTDRLDILVPLLKEQGLYARTEQRDN